MNSVPNKQRKRWLFNRDASVVAYRFAARIFAMLLIFGNRLLHRRTIMSSANLKRESSIKKKHAEHQLKSCSTSPAKLEGKRKRLLRRLSQWKYTIPYTPRFLVKCFPPVFSYGYSLFSRLLTIRKRRQRQAEYSRRNFKSMVYTRLPLNLTSRFVGRLCNTEIPRFARRSVYGAFVRTTKLDLNEAIDTDLRNYSSLSALFQRRLKPGLRTIDQDSIVVSPCDGTVLHYGIVNCDRVYQIKSARYRLGEFLGPVNWSLASGSKGSTNEEISQRVSVSSPSASLDSSSLSAWSNVTNVGAALLDSSTPAVPVDLEFQKYLTQLKSNVSNELYYVNVYLAPRDYHRFHSPVDWTVHFRRHVRGALLSVHERVAANFDNLYAVNERVVYVGQWQHGFFSMSAVGATNVGSIQTVFDKELTTNRRRRRNDPRAYERTFDGVRLYKGDEFGAFNFGSTVVLIFEAPASFKFACDSKRFPIRYGQPLFKCDSGAEQKVK